MRELRLLAWVGMIAAVAAVPGLAQQGGSGGNGGLGGTPLAGTNTANTASTTNTSSTNSSSSGSNISNQLGGTALTTLQKAPSIAISGMKASSAISSSNQMGSFYANPYYLGTWANNTNVSTVPGGFGTTLYTATGGARTTAGGAGGLGANALGGRGGAGGSGATSDPGGQIVALPRQIAYSAVVRFNTPVAPPAPTQLLTDLRGAVDRTPTAMLANPAGVQFQVDGRTVTLRGAVKDEDEARLVEGMVRLTPGVGLIKNELAYPGK